MDATNSDPAPASGDAYAKARAAVTTLIEKTAYAPYPAPPHGYPRLKTDKVAPRAARIAQRRIDNHEMRQQPSLDEPPGPGQSTIANVIALALVSPIIAMYPVMFMMHKGSAMMTVLILMTMTAVGYTALSSGIHQSAARAITRAVGYRWEPGAIEYVPWTYLLPKSLPPETPDTLRTPDGWVGTDVAIVLVAEQLAERIQEKLDTLGRPSLDGTINLDTELHEIAWGVADLLKLKAADAVDDTSAQLRRDATAKLRDALISRVAALYLYEQDLEQGAAAARRFTTLAATPETQPDMSATYAAAWLHGQAAARTHPAARPETPPH